MQSPATKFHRPLGALALLCNPLLAAAATDSSGGRIFAAPAQFTAISPALGVVRTVLALGLVLVLVFAAAVVMRRLRLLSGARAPNLEVLSQISLGARERAVLLRAGSQQLLIGVAPGNVRLLCLVPDTAAGLGAEPAAAAATPPAAAAPVASFRELLRRSLGR